MEPTSKNESLERVLQEMFGVDRRAAIRANLCVPAPIGCGNAVEGDTMTANAVHEYTISGLCQDCQRKVFGGRNDV